MPDPVVQASPEELRTFLKAFTKIDGPIHFETDPNNPDKVAYDLFDLLNGVRDQFVQEGTSDYPGSTLLLEELKDVPMLPRVFSYAARQDVKRIDTAKDRTQANSLSMWDLAMTLHQAGYLELPPIGFEAPVVEGATLSTESDSIEVPFEKNLQALSESKGRQKWDLINRGLAGFLTWIKRTDLTNEDLWLALDQIDPKLDDLYASEKAVEVFMNANDPALRRAFIEKFYIHTLNGHFLFDNLNVESSDFYDLLQALTVRDDADTIAAMLKSPNPQKVAFALLCAANLYPPEKFKQMRSKAISNTEKADTVLFTKNGYNQKEAYSWKAIKVTLRDFSDFLLQAYFNDFSTTDFWWVNRDRAYFHPLSKYVE